MSRAKKDNQAETAKTNSAKKNVKHKPTKKSAKKQTVAKRPKTNAKYRKRIYASTTLNDFVGSGTDLNQLLKLIQKDAEKRLGTDATLTEYLDRLTQFQIDDRNTIKKEAEDELITLLGKLNGMHLLNAEIPTSSPVQSAKMPSKVDNGSEEIVNDNISNSTDKEVQQGPASVPQPEVSETQSDTPKINDEEQAPTVSLPDATVSPLEPVSNSSNESQSEPDETVSINDEIESSEGSSNESTDSNYEEVQIDDSEDGAKALSSFFNADQANG